MNDGTQGDVSLKRNDSAQKEIEHESGSAWQHITASECWSKDASETCKSASLQMATENGKSDWMEERVKHRVEELATKYGLDPSKANMQDVIRARAEQGNKNEDGRLERFRRSEAEKYHLDPDKAEWKDVVDARIQARKRELGMN